MTALAIVMCHFCCTPLGGGELECVPDQSNTCQDVEYSFTDEWGRTWCVRNPDAIFKDGFEEDPGD